MVNKEPYILQQILVFLVLGIMVACSPTVRYNVLSTLFDDVPDPNKMRLTIGVDTLAQIDTTRAIAIAKAEPVSKVSYHLPYQQKDCAACHDQSSMGNLLEPEPQLCYQCHANNDHELAFTHGPAAGGYCTSCHSPHKAEERNLLIKSGDDLCFNCHNANQIATNTKHDKLEAVGCITCHNAHSSNNRAMLEVESCITCHNDYTEDYSFLHGPAGTGYCANCHDDHNSQNEKLLLVAGPQLCLSCHQKADVDIIEGHKGHEQKNCLECHNPHGGENSYLLN